MNKLKLFNYDLSTEIICHHKLSTVKNSIIHGVMPHNLLEIYKALSYYNWNNYYNICHHRIMNYNSVKLK